MTREAQAVWDEVTANVLRVLKPDGMARWWQTDIPSLCGLTPFEAFAAGRYDDVLALSRSYLETSFS